MKATCFVILTVFVFSTSSAQTIRRVNNNPGVTGVNVYSTPQEAHDAAAPNDILIIEPSDAAYGLLNVSKPLQIYGNGYFLDVNSELRADDRLSQVSVTFHSGSSGSSMYGILSYSTYIYGASSLTLERCKLDDINIYTSNAANTLHADVSDIIIRRNFISRIKANPGGGSTISNVLVSNNIIESSNNGGSPSIDVLVASHSDVADWIVRHNLISQFSGYVRLSNAVFENNLCNRLLGLIFSNVTASYNVTSGDHFVGGIGNVNNFDFSNEFVDTGSDDERLIIKSGSTLKTAASDGGEVGPFGGATPYVISGIPPIPSVTEMFNSGTGSNDTPLQVNISVRSNN